MEWVDTDLCRLALKYHSDKAHYHNYTPHYHRLLQGVHVRRALEIGLGWRGLMHADYPSGASLRMWSEYFPMALIFGLDIRRDALVNEGRIFSFICDQSSEFSLRNAVLVFDETLSGTGWFDLIVDDGSHVPEHQVLTAEVFVPCLEPGGLYVIEDVRAEGLEFVREHLGYPHEVIEAGNPHLPDDRLIVIRK